jgi:hypothetical protein
MWGFFLLSKLLRSTKCNVQTRPTQTKHDHSHILACLLSHFILFLVQGPFLSGKFWWSSLVLGEPFTNKAVWRDDYRCGDRFPLQEGHTPAQCNPESEDPCCSDFGWCGKTKDHCNYKTCIDYRTAKMGKI